MPVAAVVGAWALVYMVAATVMQATGCDPTSRDDRLVALIPALLSFVGAVMVGWWNRPTRRARRVRRRNRRRKATAKAVKAEQKAEQ